MKSKRTGNMTRRLVQLYAALLYNANLKGFIQGEIFTGATKHVCVPGLNCYSCPGAIGACPLGSLQNAITSSGKRTPHYVLGILLLFGIILGRTICGWLCPMGLIQELLYKIPGGKLKKSKVTRKLSYLKYVLLVALVVIVPIIGIFKRVPLPGFCKYICPAGTLEGAIALMLNPVNADKRSMLGALFMNKLVWLVLILLACVFIYRAFCRFLCPLGALYGLFAKVSLLGVKLDAPKCISCGKCIRTCKMDIAQVGDHECIHCGECIAVCPTNAIRWKGGKLSLPKNEVGREEGKEEGRTRRRGVRIAVITLAVLSLLAVFYYANRDVLIKANDEAAIETKTPLASEVDESLPIGAKVGMRCPEMTLRAIDSDERITIGAADGKVQVINFWATWCAPCLAELPEFERIHKEYPDDVRVTAVHSQYVTEDVPEFLKGYSYTLPFALDEDGSALKALEGSSMLPMTVIVDQTGVIRYNKTGSITYEQLIQELAPLM